MKSNKKSVIAYLFTHWDPEWYRSISAFNVRLVEIFDKVLLSLNSKKIPSFYFDGQIFALKNYLEFRPEKERLVKKLIKEKRLFIGPFYASSDNFLVSGASLIKNLEFGINYSKKMGQNDFIGYLSDTFGHSKGIFKILKYFNINNAIVWRGTPDIEADFKFNDINTTRLVYGYYQDILQSSVSIEKKAEITKKVLDKINAKSGSVLLLPLGGDHLNIGDDVILQIEKINALLDDYEIKISSPFEYIKKADYKKRSLTGELLDNSTTFVLPGVYSCRTDEKKENAKLQFELFMKAIPYNVFTGGKYKAELNYAVQELIKNHAHDSIYGCSVDSVHKMVRTRQLKVKETIEAVYGSLNRDFKNKYLLNENSSSAGVFNFSPFEQNGVIKIISDKKIKNAQKIRSFNFVSSDIYYDTLKNPMTEDFHGFFEYLIETDSIKPFSFKNIEIKKPEIRHRIGDDFIENDFIKLFVLDNKIFVIDKKTNKIYEDFISLHSTVDDGDSYNYAPISLPYILKLKKAKVLKKGEIKSTLQLTFEENIKLNFSIFNKLNYIDIEADFINKKKNRKLQIVFNTQKKITKTLAEDCIGLIERNHDPDYLLYNQMPVQTREELKTNSYPMQRFVSANGLTVYTEGLNEYEIYKNDLKIALLRSVGIISNPNNKARGVPAGPPIECHDMQGVGGHSFRLAFNFSLDGVSEIGSGGVSVGAFGGSIEAGVFNPFKTADNFYSPFNAILGEFKIKNKTYLKNPENKVFYGFLEDNTPFLSDVFKD